MGEPVGPISGEAARKALSPVQTGAAGDRDAAIARATLDEQELQELQDLEAVEPSDAPPTPVAPPT